MSILSIIQEIANVSSNNKKIELLKKYETVKHLSDIIFFAMSPRIKFYIKTFDIPTNEQTKPNEISSVFSTLERLYKREVTGSAARNELDNCLKSLNNDDRELIVRVVRKNLQWNMGSTLVNKVFPKLIEETPYMGAKPFSKKLVDNILKKGQAFSQCKMDGRYLNAIVANGEVYMESRQGETTYLYDAVFAKELKKFDEVVFNGELVIPGKPRYESNGIISSLVTIGKKMADGESYLKDLSKLQKESTHTYGELMGMIEFVVWDVISYDEYQNAYSPNPYSTRWATLYNMLTMNHCTKIRQVESTIVTSYNEVMEHYALLASRGEEGTVVKAYDAEWKDGKGNDQVKIKKEENFDLIITGFKKGKERTKNENRIASVFVETHDGLLKTCAGDMTDAMMNDITENQDKYIGMIAEIKCSGVSRDSNGNYSLLHPVFIKIRDDKKQPNTLEECLAIDRMTSGL